LSAFLLVKQMSAPEEVKADSITAKQELDFKNYNKNFREHHKK
jgi:hypothetical protein